MIAKSVEGIEALLCSRRLSALLRQSAMRAACRVCAGGRPATDPTPRNSTAEK